MKTIATFKIQSFKKKLKKKHFRILAVGSKVAYIFLLNCNVTGNYLFYRNSYKSTSRNIET